MVQGRRRAGRSNVQATRAGGHAPAGEEGMNKNKDIKTEQDALDAVQKNGMALMRIPNNLRTEEICLTAVEADGMALEFVPLNSSGT